MPRAESKSMDSAASSAQSAETKTEEKQDFDENELLMYVAADANEHLFGEKSELTQFVNAHAADDHQPPPPAGARTRTSPRASSATPPARPLVCRG